MSSSTTESAAATEQVLMPKMGISVSEGTISVWTKDPGDQVDDGETICEVTTDKVDVEIPAPAAGRLTKLLAEVGETVASGEPIAEIAVGDGDGEVAKPADDSPELVATSPGLAEADRDGDAAGAPGATRGRVPRGEPGRVTASGEVDRSGFLSPVVRRIAARHSIDLGGVRGSGIGGRIRKRDLLSHVAARPKQQRALHSESPYRPEPEAEPSRAKPASTPAAPNGAASNGDPTLLERPGDRREPMSAMRKTIARRMVESRRTSAHCTTIVEVDMSQVVAARRQLREGMAERGVGLTYLAFVARAVTEALGEFPQLNASVEGEEIILHSGVDMGIAVAVEKGLVVPVIRDAQRLGLEGMAAAIGELAVKARSG
ncbi:MAG: 2-oxo acid dehydrogenase subunit E2, partial [Solirubrobacterales bacterium]|nr:2-oxo acid dehydrogenase subunit E2 [Solirubrobacterales bacterium]